MMRLGMVLKVQQAATVSGSMPVADVIDIQSRNIISGLLCPVSGAGGPLDWGFIQPSTCSEAEQQQVLDAIAKGQPFDPTTLSGAMVAYWSSDPVGFVVQVLPHPRASKDHLALPESSRPTASKQDLPPDVSPPEPVPPPDVPKDKTPAWIANYQEGWLDAVRDQLAGTTIRTADLDNALAAYGGIRWNQNKNIPTLEGYAWKEGYIAGSKAPQPEPTTFETASEPIQRTDAPADQEEKGAKKARPTDKTDAFWEHRGVRVVVNQDGVLLDLRDSGGAAKFQGLVTVLAGDTSLTIEKDKARLHANTIEIVGQEVVIDGHTVYCGKKSTFALNPVIGIMPGGQDGHTHEVIRCQQTKVM